MKLYRVIDSFEVIVDNPKLEWESISHFLVRKSLLTIENKQSDLFDSSIEYWTDASGWTYKIEKDKLKFLEEIK